MKQKCKSQIIIFFVLLIMIVIDLIVGRNEFKILLTWFIDIWSFCCRRSRVAVRDSNDVSDDVYKDDH